jgi:hypothetical protein
LQFALTQLVPVFKQGRVAVDTAKREVKELRDKINLQPTDKPDIVVPERNGWPR